MQVNLYVSHPTCTFKLQPRYTCKSVEGAFTLAYADIADGMAKDCSVWIEAGESRVLIQTHDGETPWNDIPRQ